MMEYTITVKARFELHSDGCSLARVWLPDWPIYDDCHTKVGWAQTPGQMLCEALTEAVQRWEEEDNEQGVPGEGHCPIIVIITDK